MEGERVKRAEGIPLFDYWAISPLHWPSIEKWSDCFGILAALTEGLRRVGGVLRKEQVVDNWSILIGNAQGRAEEIFNDTDSFLEASGAPGLKRERKEMAPGLISGALGKRRDFIIVTDTRSLRLKPFRTFVNARDYGNNLDVSWYLTYGQAFGEDSFH